MAAWAMSAARTAGTAVSRLWISRTLDVTQFPDEDDEASDMIDREDPDPSDMDDSDESDTIECPYCGKSVFEQAEWCHHCGKYLSEEDRANRMPSILMVGVVLGIILVLSGLIAVFAR